MSWHWQRQGWTIGEMPRRWDIHLANVQPWLKTGAAPTRQTEPTMLVL